ncbi:MAG: hypothetical protein ACLPWF_08555 [Bryobacteraceae bacterium]|jgi:hypothetical protein
MKYFRIPSLVTVTLLLAATVAPAQTRFTQRSYPDVTDAYQSGLKLYYKTWADLNDAQKRVTPYPGDWYRYEVARGQMDLLERTWQDGSFDRKQLNDAIDDVQFVLKVNYLSDQDRQVLEEDLNRLRDIRIRYGG